MKEYTLQEYIEMKSDPIPYTTNFGMEIDEIEILCPECESKTTNNKYKFCDFTNSTDLISVGLCEKCDLVVTSKKMRFYEDGRYSWIENGEWVTYKQSIIDKIKNWIFSKNEKRYNTN
jgi:hypothetical protein